jgi:ribonuclease D
VNAWVRTRPELEALVGSLRPEPAIALDTESDSLHHHREKVCLLQLATGPDRAWLVDPLALGDLSPLAGIIGNPAVTVVLHGADYDVTSLKRDFGIVMPGLFDTMIAARFLGRAQHGLQAVLRDELSISLSKDSQLDDWSRRPLTRRQETYALDDVRHLLALHARLAGELRDRGRLDWVAEECAVVAALEPARKDADSEAWLKLKGARRLAPRQMAVLRALVGWREEVARATDVPAFKILSTEKLLALAAAPPRRPQDLREQRGPWMRWPERVPALLDAVARALALPDRDLPRPKSLPRPVVSEATRRRIASLRAWRADAGARSGLDASLVLPGRLLDQVAERMPRHPGELEAIAGFRRWRRRTFGDEIVAAVASVPA